MPIVMSAPYFRAFPSDPTRFHELKIFKPHQRDLKTPFKLKQGGFTVLVFVPPNSSTRNFHCTMTYESKTKNHKVPLPPGLEAAAVPWLVTPGDGVSSMVPSTKLTTESSNSKTFSKYHWVLDCGAPRGTILLHTSGFLCSPKPPETWHLSYFDDLCAVNLPQSDGGGGQIIQKSQDPKTLRRRTLKCVDLE